MSTRRRSFRRSLLALCLGAAACSPVYVLRAGIEEAEILARRRPIPAVAADPNVSAEERRKLRLVLEARDFAERVLDLAAGESYTSYARVDRDTLLLVVSAARQDRFQAHTWWFPIVGHVPYKGFFDFDAARREAASLESNGYDTYVRPSPAFSTLGWFDDPVLSTVLRASDVGLVSTVLHEIFHNTLFIPSHISFNESLASFAGDRGAILFFCLRDGEDTRLCQQAEDAWHDTLLFGEFLSGFVAELQALYGNANLTTEQKIEQREHVFRAARTRFEEQVRPELRSSYRGWSRTTINNATLIGTRLYYHRLDLFERVYEAYDEDLVAALAAIRRATASREGDPFEAVEALLDH